jgi:hypothetical protein
MLRSCAATTRRDAPASVRPHTRAARSAASPRATTCLRSRSTASPSRSARLAGGVGRVRPARAAAPGPRIAGARARRPRPGRRGNGAPRPRRGPARRWRLDVALGQLSGGVLLRLRCSASVRS